MKKSILFLYLPFVLFILTCSNPKKNEKEEIVILFKEFINELISLRQSYNLRIDSIKTIEINDLSYIKDIYKINQIKSTINQQRLIDNWNYIKNKNLFNEWKEKFNVSFQNSTNEDVRLFLQELNNSAIELSETRNKMSKIESDYLNSYEKYLNFLLDNNNHIKLVKKNIIIDNQSILTEYNIVTESYRRNENIFYEYSNNYKKVMSIKIKEINSKLNIQEVNDALDIMR